MPLAPAGHAWLTSLHVGVEGKRTVPTPVAPPIGGQVTRGFNRSAQAKAYCSVRTLVAPALWMQVMAYVMRCNVQTPLATGLSVQVILGL